MATRNSILEVSIPIILGIIITALLIWSGFTPHIAFGESMGNERCVYTIQNKNAEITNISESDVIVYENQMRSEVTFTRHRVIDKINSYDNQQSKYKYNKQTNKFIMDDPHYQKHLWTDIPENGETVMITKGDGNPNIDPAFVTNEELYSKNVFSQSLPRPICNSIKEQRDI